MAFMTTTDLPHIARRNGRDHEKHREAARDRVRPTSSGGQARAAGFPLRAAASGCQTLGQFLDVVLPADEVGLQVGDWLEARP
jgi:hypothetical protein